MQDETKKTRTRSRVSEESTQATPVVEADAEETVTVKKSELEIFIKKLSELEESNKRLLAVADKGRMAHIEEKERGKMRQLPTVKLSRFGGPTGKLIMAWRMPNNEAYVDGGRIVEHQTMELFYEDGTSETMPLITFYRQQNKDTIARVLARSRDEQTGGEMLRVELSDGRVVDIELKFVN